MDALLLQEAARAEAVARLQQARAVSPASPSLAKPLSCEEARSPIDAWRARDAALASERAAKDGICFRKLREKLRGA